MSRIYLDHAATTPLPPEVQAAMGEALAIQGNPSSTHLEGRQAKEALDQAREAFANRLGCLFGEITFTSSGTESANLAILGAALAHNGDRRKILLGATEHHAVLHTTPLLERLGFEVVLVPCDREGGTGAEQLPENLDDVLLVSVMMANNELGTINPVPQIAERCREAGAIFHCDASQAFPFVMDTAGWAVADLGADMVTLSAHKFYGPKGVGLLYCRAGLKLSPLSVGGTQEREVRAGTENLAGIVGSAAGLSWTLANASSLGEKRDARDEFLRHLSDHFVRSTPSVETLPGHAHVRAPGVDAETALIVLDRAGISASSGSACSSGSLEPSHVLLACGFSEAEALEGLRFTFGFGQDAEIGRAAAQIVNEAIESILARRS